MATAACTQLYGAIAGLDEAHARADIWGAKLLSQALKTQRRSLPSGLDFPAGGDHLAGTPAPCECDSTPSGMTTHGSFDCVQM